MRAVPIAMDSDPADAEKLQTRLAQLCGQAGLTELAAFEWTCAIVEAVNNCIEHAYGGEAGHPISLLWTLNANVIVVEIRDRGRPVPTPLPSGEISLDAESGRGWHIIRNWSDSVAFTTYGDENVLTLTRRL
jgi:serine/threonine-protein kinase RsbW